jgi:peroxiredoxin family protein
MSAQNETGTAERIQALEQLVAQHTEKLTELEEKVDQEKLVIGVISGDLDKVIASFIIAMGATAYDMEVDMFFTFWGTAALRDPKKSVKKDFMSRMFGWMLPRGSKKLPLSQMNMAGMGPMMIRDLMKKKGVKSLEEMIKEAGELGVRIHVCEMSMNLMGFKKEELIDYPNLDICGVGTYIDMASRARQSFFM